MKKAPSKIAHNLPRPFFSVLPIGPNPAQISIPVSLKSPTVELLYNDIGAKSLLLYNNIYCGLKPNPDFARRLPEK